MSTTGPRPPRGVRLRRVWRTTRGLPYLVSLASALLVLGPALRPGLVQAYDLGWSPDPRFTPAVLGEGVPSPRVVPSDAVAVAMGHLLGAALAQKVILVGILVLGSVGAVALLRLLSPNTSRLAAAATALAAQWNPFVAERLVIGQWTVLLGYALIPCGVHAALRARSGVGSRWACGYWLIAAGLGGANSIVMTASAVGIVLLWPRPRWWPAVVAGACTVTVSAGWWLPAIVRGGRADPVGTRAFGAAPDTPLGLVGSLLSGGGMWNSAAHPEERMTWPVAVAGLVLAVGALGVLVLGRRRSSLIPLVGAGLMGLIVAAASGSAWCAPAWGRLLATAPGGGLLRDGHKFVALWAILVAVGVGLLVELTMRIPAGFAFSAAATLVALPLVLLPSMAWGFGGRLAAHVVPQDLRAGASAISGAPAGVVGVLPWGQYRQYEWNDERVSLGLLPRMIDQRVRYDDSLPLASGLRVAGEDLRSAAVTRAIDSGVDPVDALVASGVRYIAVERGTGLESVRSPTGTIIVNSPHLLVVDVQQGAGTPAASSRDAVLVAGWVTTLLAIVAAALSLLGHAFRTAWEARRELLCSGP